MKNHLKGSCCGLLVFLILLPTLNLPSEWSAKSLYWSRFKLCAPCGEPRGLECVIEVCESDNKQEK